VTGEGGRWRAGAVGGREPVSERLWERRAGGRGGWGQRSVATRAAPVWSAVSIRRGAFHSPCVRWVGGRGVGGRPARRLTSRRCQHRALQARSAPRGRLDHFVVKTTRQEALQATISPGP